MRSSGECVLLTGGAGFIGSHLAERLAADHEVIALDNGHRDALSAVSTLRGHPRVHFLHGDTLDRPSLTKAFKNVGVVIHLAAIAGVSSYYSEPLKTLEVNILGTRNVLEASREAGVAQFVYFSTSEIFGSLARDVSEDDPSGIGPSTDRRWVYATSKLAGEHFALRSGEIHGFTTTVVRPFNIYGPRQVGEGAISNFCRAIHAGEPMKVYAPGTAIRAWCYISDLVDAVVAILERRDASAGKIFNIGNPDEPVSTEQLAERLRRLAPGARVERVQVEHAEVAERVPRIDHARRVLGFAPKVSLDAGLRRTLGWFASAKAERA